MPSALSKSILAPKKGNKYSDSSQKILNKALGVLLESMTKRKDPLIFYIRTQNTMSLYFQVILKSNYIIDVFTPFLFLYEVC